MLNNNVKNTIKEIKEEPSAEKVRVNPRTQTQIGIKDVLEAVKHLGENKDYVIKSILAVYISTFLEKKDPLWIMLVGNPSSNKTTLVELIGSLDDIYKLDTMTSNPFSSGQKQKEKPQDLLPRLDDKCFVIKEYGTIFGRNDDMVKQLLSDLVAIYDGEYSKHSPLRGTIRYNSYFSHIGCVTPMALSSRQRYMNMVGARFMFLRIEVLTVEEKKESLRKIWDEAGHLSKQEVATIVCEYCLFLKGQVENKIEVKFTEDSKAHLNNLASLMARARGIVLSERTSFKDDEGKTKHHYEVTDIQIEEPFRALKQLRKTARCLAIVCENNEVGEEELGIVKRIVLSSMPVRRADVLKVFELGQVFTAKQAAKKINKNYRTTKRILDELAALGVVEGRKDGNDLARVYTLKNEFEEIFSPPDIKANEVATIFGGEFIN